jgi:hypothetical protein
MKEIIKDNVFFIYVIIMAIIICISIHFENNYELKNKEIELKILIEKNKNITFQKVDK